MPPCLRTGEAYQRACVHRVTLSGLAGRSAAFPELGGTCALRLSAVLGHARLLDVVPRNVWLLEQARRDAHGRTARGDIFKDNRVRSDGRVVAHLNLAEQLGSSADVHALTQHR